MRSRPKIQVFLQGQAHPGGRLLVDIEVAGKSRTPVDGIDVLLWGRERSAAHRSASGSSSTLLTKDVEHLALGVRLAGRMLPEGITRERVAFDLPASIPPSLETRWSKIAYQLDIRIDIPWWPDRRGHYAVPVELAPQPLGPPRPVRLVSARGGPQGDELYAEVSFEDSSIVPGETFRGAVSVHNLRGRRLRSVVVSLVAVDRARFLAVGATSAPEAMRWETTVFEGTPADGATLPFAIRFPASVTPSLTARWIQLEHFVEIKAAVAWGSDLVLQAPVTVVPARSGADRPRASARRVPPVGFERRAQAWAEVAQRAGLANDTATERMVGTIGQVGVVVQVEDRRGEGLWTTATLRWPDLGIGVQLSERRWHDLLGGPIAVGDPELRRRFSVRGRESAQVRAFLEAGVAAALSSFAEATLEDDGCLVALPGGGFSVAVLETFVDSLGALARAVDAALPRVPPPLAFTPHLPAWKKYALRLGGTLTVGTPRIDGSLEGEPVRIAAAWEGADLAGSDLMVLRRADSGGGEDDHDEEDPPDREALAAAPERIRSVLDALTAAGGRVHASVGRLVARQPGVLEDPERAEPILRALASWSRSLRGAAEQGPYR